MHEQKNQFLNEIMTGEMIGWYKALDVVFWTAVGCGDNHTVLALQDGRVFSFGSNDFGQLGHTKPRTRPEQVDCLDAQVIRRLACGARHTLALNEWGQVG